jgi:hypothetical protein
LDTYIVCTLLLQFLGSTPELGVVSLYPAESFPILGDADFIKWATAENEPRRQGHRVFKGSRLSLQRLAEILCTESQIPFGQLCVPHKGDRRLTRLREKFPYAATRILFHPAAQVARFLRVSPCTISF